MKKIKLFSAIALSAFAATLAVQITSAVEVTSPSNKAEATTDGEITFGLDSTVVDPPSIEDPTVPDPKDPDDPNVTDPAAKSALALTKYPKKFSFGDHDVDATILYDTSVQHYPLVDQTGVVYGNENVGVQVQDGRMNNDEWNLTVELNAGSFANLTGATISFENPIKATQYVTGAGANGFTGKVEVAAGGAAAQFFSVAGAGNKAKGFSSLSFANKTDINLNVTGDNIRTGTHTGTLTWTLSGTPDA
ncbi:WxL domain surface cell wall-binding [Pilibacter termitis]|uniref:WxL domain surface cell wall-binding n=1 Tax=Pilibacter termitis TaxID=263852 RepID=A0A1T4KC53_9ENTE|nr:WxL domain-containing protein [Pilibacter termitis]SJZ39992.1 WxL domain surface cell wall-binding [Pilibacter termitis]